jgi:flagellar assembly protein FliH
MSFTPQAMSAYSFRQLDAVATPGEDTLAAALAEADAIREAARAEGAAEGRREAQAAVAADAADRLALLTDARNALDELREQLCAQLEADAVLLGLRLAEQIVAGTIEVEPERLTEIAGLALRRLADRRSVTLVVNPADLELVSDSVENLTSQLGGIEHLSVQADRRVGRGGAIARTEAGDIDAGLPTQLSRAREIAMAALSPEPADAA